MPRDSLDANKICELVTDWLSEKQGYLELFRTFRTSCEGWLKGEMILLLFRAMHKGLLEEFRPEAEIGGIGTTLRRCDFWVKTGATETWVQMKVVVTNYGGYSGKPITQQIAKCRGDISGLQAIQSAGKGEVVFLMLAYPFMNTERETLEWSRQISRLASSGMRLAMESKIKLIEGEARLYCFESEH